MKILLIGHACCPGKGSEPGNTWNWAEQLSKWHEVWLIAHPQFREEVDQYVQDHPNPAIHLVWVTLSGFDPWNPARGQFGVKLHYMLWLRKALSAARALHTSINFDVVHHVSLATISTGSPFWRIPAPFVWGPVGGGQRSPNSFLRYFGTSWPAEIARTLRVNSLRFIPEIRRTVKRACVALATNPETEEVLRSAGARRVRFVLDCAVPPGFQSDQIPQRTRPERFTLLWAGRMVPQKGPLLALQGLAAVQDRSIQLRMVGDGPLLDALRQAARDLGIDGQVRFLGRVSHSEMKDLYRQSSGLLFTSLRDSTGNTVMEAMAHGIAPIILDHQGVGAFMPDAAGLKVPVTAPEETIDGLAAAIRRLSQNPAEAEAMGNAGWEYARTQNWDSRGREMDQLYREVMGADRNI